MLPHPKNWEPHFSAPELGLMRDGKRKKTFFIHRIMGII
jgi:hypothetical protein